MPDHIAQGTSAFLTHDLITSIYMPWGTEKWGIRVMNGAETRTAAGKNDLDSSFDQGTLTLMEPLNA